LWLLAEHGLLQLTGSLALRAVLLGLWERRPDQVLTVRQLDFAAARDDEAHFVMWFMLVVSFVPGSKSAIYD